MRSSDLLRRWWLKGIVLVAVSFILYVLNSQKTVSRSYMILWTAGPQGTNSYPVVTNIAFLPNGTLGTATDGASLRLWDAATGTLKTTIEVSDMPRCGTFASPFAFSPNGHVIASVECDGRAVQLWDARTGGLLRTLNSNPQYYLARWSSVSANCITISPDTKIIAVAATKLKDKKVPGAIQLWDVATGKLLRILHTQMQITAIAFAPDSKTLVSAGGNLNQPTYYLGNGKDGEVKLWDTQTGTVFHALPGMTTPAMAAAFSPDGKTLALSKDGVSLWNVQTGQLLHSLKGRIAGQHDAEGFGPIEAHALVYSPDGSMLVGALNREAVMWDARTGNFLSAFKLLNTPMTVGDLDVGAVAFAPDSRTLAIAGRLQRTVTVCQIK